MSPMVGGFEVSEAVARELLAMGDIYPLDPQWGVTSGMPVGSMVGAGGGYELAPYEESLYEAYESVQPKAETVSVREVEEPYYEPEVMPEALSVGAFQGALIGEVVGLAQAGYSAYQFVQEVTATEEKDMANGGYPREAGFPVDLQGVGLAEPHPSMVKKYWYNKQADCQMYLMTHPKNTVVYFARQAKYWGWYKIRPNIVLSRDPRISDIAKAERAVLGKLRKLAKKSKVLGIEKTAKRLVRK